MLRCSDYARTLRFGRQERLGLRDGPRPGISTPGHRSTWATEVVRRVLPRDVARHRSRHATPPSIMLR